MYSMYSTSSTARNSGWIGGKSAVADVSVVDGSAHKASSSVTAVIEDDVDDVSILLPKLQSIQCPICLENYPFAEIESHADNCSTWLLEEDDELSFDFLEPRQPSTTDGVATVTNEFASSEQRCSSN